MNNLGILKICLKGSGAQKNTAFYMRMFISQLKTMLNYMLGSSKQEKTLNISEP
jgi:hypothetical protein